MRGRRRGPEPPVVDPRVKQLEAENREAGVGRDDHQAPTKKVPRFCGSLKAFDSEIRDRLRP